MELESTTSQSIAGGQGDQPSNNYLINTSKAVRGHKLRTRDFIKLQMMRFRRCSPVKYEDLQEKQPLPHQDYPRFRGFPEEESVQGIVADQREKLSRDTRGRMKLFNNSKINSVFEPSPNFHVKSKPATSQHVRPHQSSNFATFNDFRTVPNDTSLCTVSREKRCKKAPMFRSDNLGDKMNEYLNIFLSTEETKNQSVLQKEEQQRYSHTLEVVRNKPNTFVRRMKRHHRRAEDSKTDMMGQFKSEQLVKPKTAQSIARKLF